MKNKPTYLVNEAARRKVINQLLDEPIDGTRKVTITNVGTKSSKQRGLQWIWYADVVKSGVGGRDEASEKRLHLVSKYRWCLPIQIRDDNMFADLWLEYYQRHCKKTNASAYFEWFVDKHVSTEALDNSQMAEYLTKFRDHYALELGVNLSDPDEGLLIGAKKNAA